MPRRQFCTESLPFLFPLEMHPQVLIYSTRTTFPTPPFFTTLARAFHIPRKIKTSLLHPPYQPAAHSTSSERKPSITTTKLLFLSLYIYTHRKSIRREVSAERREAHHDRIMRIPCRLCSKPPRTGHQSVNKEILA